MEDTCFETGRPAGYGASERQSLETGLGGAETLVLPHPQSSLTSSSEAVWVTHRADRQSGEEGTLGVYASSYLYQGL